MTGQESRFLDDYHSGIFEEDYERKVRIRPDSVAGVCGVRLDRVAVVDEIAFAGYAIIHADAALRD